MTRFFCSIPFTSLILKRNYRICCGDRMFLHKMGDVSVGKFPNGPLEVFNSEAVVAIRKSILDGSFKYCLHCPYYQKSFKGWNGWNGQIEKVEEIKEEWKLNIIKNNLSVIDPATVPLDSNFSYDNTCNLKCRICRARHCGLKPRKQKKLLMFQDMIINTWFPLLHWANISGSGEPLASGIFYKLLSETPVGICHPKLKIYLRTNGLLLIDRWDGISLKDKIDTISISIDAATEKTYRTNRGASWTKLMKNLDFIHSKKELVFNFVVQNNNWEEMKQFVLLAKKYNAKVLFQGLCKKQEFQVTKHNEFQHLLKDPFFDDPNVSFTFPNKKPSSI